MENISAKLAAPSVWGVVLGYNHPEDSVECLQSLLKSDWPNLIPLYVDNGSEEAALRKVLDEVPPARVVRLRNNVGVSRGFNAGLAYALGQGTDYILMINNDTMVHPLAVRRLVEAAEAEPEAGILVPKIFYHSDPKVIWSAGSRFRKFPPVVVMQKTKVADDGRFDRCTELEFTTFCAVLLRGRMLEQIGLLDTDFYIYAEDYDMSIRAREAGFRIRLVPDAHIWHKVSKSMRAGSRNPSFWENYGRSTAIFCRKHAGYRGLTGPAHVAYVIARFIAQGQYYGTLPFLRGYRAGHTAVLNPAPKWKDRTVDPVEPVRVR